MTEQEKVGRIGVLERRKLGLTFGNALRITRKLQADGTLIADDPQAAAAQVAAAMVAENPGAFKAAAGADWEEFFNALVAFIEKMMPLILQLIEIFSAI